MAWLPFGGADYSGNLINFVSEYIPEVGAMRFRMFRGNSTSISTTNQLNSLNLTSFL